MAMQRYCFSDSLFIGDHFQTISIGVQNPIGRTKSCGRCPYCCFQYLSIHPEINPLWLAIGIDAHHLPPVVGPIALKKGIIQGII